jgi:hypothetical protein
MGGFKNKFLLNRYPFTIPFFKINLFDATKNAEAKETVKLRIISTLSSKLGLGL